MLFLYKTKKHLLHLPQLFSDLLWHRKKFMLEKGRIEESGTHGELMRLKGSYYELYESQRKLEAYIKEAEYFPGDCFSD